MIEGGKQLHLEGRLIVRENGTYQIVVDQDDMNGSGVWKVEGDSFITTDTRENVVVYKIKELSDNTLVTAQEVKMDTPQGTVAGKITLTYKR